ncbi:MAG: pyridoxamine 5'-phosphate oxidase family protein [Clostridia bacterium]|nr:pyridoxamine 5'-phosphate oxidase family protein [Clostridia bacterium]
MFRELTRKKQQLTQEECIDLLKAQPRGVLSLIGDDGYPYGLPMNHFYEDGVLYFHSGMTGHKVDAIRACNKASFCVYDQGFRKPGDWALTIKSVIVFGRIRVIEDPAEAIGITRRLSLKFTSDTEYIEKEIRSAGARTLVFALEPEHICGKLVHES